MSKKNQHIVNVYSFSEDTNPAIKKFPKMTEEWLDFVVGCRRGQEHPYDIVEGPIADDTIWDYIEEFVKGNISREAFWVLVKFKYPIHQVVFCTQVALGTLTFERSYVV